ncbi:SigE family RNA polymerase sigma factor, partial [Streptomyces fradiae]
MTDEEFAVFYAQAVRRLTGQLYVMTGDFHEAHVRRRGRRRRLGAGPVPGD